MPVASVTEIVASSQLGWEEAMAEGLNRASKTLRNITGVEVISQKVKVERGEVLEFRVRLKINFILDEWTQAGHW